MSTTSGEACWRRIGVRGDRSCPELEQYTHCMNCPVTARAATELLDRPGLPPEDPPAPPPATPKAVADTSALPVLVFRLGTERFAIECRDAVSVERPRRVQRVPHRHARGFRGLCNVHGELRPCASLHLVLGLGDAAAEESVIRRLVVVDVGGKPWTFEADEVWGVHRVALDALIEPPATVARDASSCTRARFRLGSDWVAVLDRQRLWRALDETLS